VAAVRSEIPETPLLSKWRYTAPPLVLATPFATWWLVGDLTELKGRRSNLYYMMRAPDVPDRIATALGVASCVVVGVASALIALGLLSRQLDRGWLPVVAPLVIAGVIGAYSYRATTAGTIGANIGGGLALGFGGALVLALVVAAATAAHQMDRS
jgi:hypothetical protein